MNRDTCCISIDIDKVSKPNIKMLYKDVKYLCQSMDHSQKHITPDGNRLLEMDYYLLFILSCIMLFETD